MNEARKKILLMPSWYPNQRTRSGSFFKEQAQFLNSSGFDIKVLLCEYIHTKCFIYQFIKRLLKAQGYQLTKNYLDQNPEAYSFPIIIQKNWSDKKKVQVQNKAYLKAFQRLISNGWIPEMIHVQGTFRAGFSAQIISELFDIPYVVIEHSPFNLKAHSKFIREQIISVLNKAYKVGGVSNYQKQRILENGIDRPVEVVWNFMDETKFNFKAYVESSKFIIVSITRPVKVKDVDTLFKAIQLFRELIGANDIEAIIIGNNVLSDKKLVNTNYFDQLATELEIQDICKFIPYMDREKIEGLMHKSNVFISTSIDEPYGVAIREAMLCGVPVISTRSGGPEDSINDQTGILVNLKDYRAIAENLVLIYENRINFDTKYIRNYVISQSGRRAFLKRMEDFYSMTYD